MSKRTILSTISILLLALSINICYADLPVHCLKSQVSGEWKLEISELQTVTPPYKMNCGHESPDNPANSYLALKDTFKPVTEFRADLNHDTKVYTDGVEKGKWTMVYDEGLDITLGDHKFTAFFEYFPDETGTVMSNCGKTVVGWYKNLLSGERACFRGEKLLKSEAEKEKLYTKSLQQITLETPDTTLSFLQMNLKSREAKTLNSFAKSNDGSVFADYESIVEKINQNPDKLWTAKVYPDFQGKTMNELNMFVGRKKYGASRKNPLLVNSLLQTSDTSDLPKEFTWKDYIHPAKNQGGCGSCFAVATIGMLESRLKIKYNRDFLLSTQHVLDCSMENQGCKGGYPYFVNTFISSNELVPENCSPYVGAKVSCTTCDLSKLDETYHVKDYGFVGGSFGKSNERDMMIELMNNGPIVVSIEPSSEFMMYSGGVFKSLEPTEWVKLKLEKPEWEKVDHSVLLYGWGETENGVKFWTIQNSWGPNWGDNGSFKMIRGIDESAVESVGEFANPYIVKKK